MPFALNDIADLIAPIVGSKARALYEYISKLEAQGGVFPKRKGTERGLRATSKNKAKLLIAIMCAARMSRLKRDEVVRLEIAPKIRDALGEPTDGGVLQTVRPAIDEPTFGRALEQLFGDVGVAAVAAGVQIRVEVTPSYGLAVITYRHAPTGLDREIPYGRPLLNYRGVTAVHRLDANGLGAIIVALHQASERLAAKKQA